MSEIPADGCFGFEMGGAETDEPIFHPTFLLLTNLNVAL